MRNGDISPIDEIPYKQRMGLASKLSGPNNSLVVFGGIGNFEAILIYLQGPNFGFKG